MRREVMLSADRFPLVPRPPGFIYYVYRCRILGMLRGANAVEGRSDLARERRWRLNVRCEFLYLLHSLCARAKRLGLTALILKNCHQAKTFLFHCPEGQSYGEHHPTIPALKQPRYIYGGRMTRGGI